MPIPKKISNFLEKEKVKWQLVEHKTVYTGYDKAVTLGVKPQIVAKTLVVKLDGDLGLVLLASNRNFDQEKFLRLVNALRKKAKERLYQKISFVKESLVKGRFKGVKPGSIPLIEEIWKMKVFSDSLLMKSQKVIINGGDYRSSIMISPAELKKLNKGMLVLSFSKPKK